MSEIKDSGNRTEFGTGAVRDIQEDWDKIVAPFRKVVWVKEDGRGVIRLGSGRVG